MMQKDNPEFRWPNPLGGEDVTSLQLIEEVRSQTKLGELCYGIWVTEQMGLAAWDAAKPDKVH